MRLSRDDSAAWQWKDRSNMHVRSLCLWGCMLANASAWYASCKVKTKLTSLEPAVDGLVQAHEHVDVTYCHHLWFHLLLAAFGLFRGHHIEDTDALALTSAVYACGLVAHPDVDITCFRNKMHFLKTVGRLCGHLQDCMCEQVYLA